MEGKTKNAEKMCGSYHNYLFVRGGRSPHSPKFTMRTSQIIFQQAWASVLSLATSSCIIFDSHFVHPKSIFHLSCFHPTKRGRRWKTHTPETSSPFRVWHIRPAGTTPKRPSPCCNVPRRVTGFTRSWTKWYPNWRHIWNRIDTENSHSWKEVHFWKPIIFFHTKFLVDMISPETS